MRSQALIITKYLLLHRVINPLLRNIKKILALVALSILIGVLVGVASTFMSKGQQAPGSEAEGPPGSGLRAWLVSHGITKEVGVLIVEAYSLFSLLMWVYKPETNLAAHEDAEYEILLSQPVSLGSFIRGQMLYRMLTAHLSFLMMGIGAFSFALMLSNDPRKALLAFPAAILLLSEIMAITYILSIIWLHLGRRGEIIWRALAAYLLAGLLLSLPSRRPSLLLEIPFGPLARPLVYSATISVPREAIAGALGRALPLIAACWLVAFILAGRLELEPEQLAPVRLAVPHESPVALDLETAEAALRSYFLAPIFRRRRLAIEALALALVSLLGLFLSRFPSLAALCESAVMIALLFGVVSTFGALFAMILAWDLACYWVFRVYALRMGEVARCLLLKYVTRLLEFVVFFACFEAALEHSVAWLLAPIFALPAVTLAASLVVLVGAFIASRRRVLRRTQGNLYASDELLVLLAEAFVLMLMVDAWVSARLVARLGWPMLLAALPSAAALSYLIYAGCSRLIARLLERWDVAT